MKKTILSLFSILLIASTFGQQPYYVVVQNQSIRMAVMNTVITVTNLENKEIQVVFNNAIEDTVKIKKKATIIIHAIPNAQYIRAVIVGNSCGQTDCGLILQLNCNLLPIVISNVQVKRISASYVKVDFDAFNTGGPTQSYFICQYSTDNGLSWGTLKLNLPSLTGLNQHFSQTIKID